MEQDKEKDKKKRKKVRIVAIAVVALIVLTVLWIFTPFGFFGVKPQGQYQMKLTVGDREMTATMENNTSAWALHRMLERGDKTIHLRDYGGMEKVGILWKGLPRNDAEISAQPGDLILFMGGSFVIYYNTNHWNFTRLGRINDVSQEELKNTLGDGNVDVTLSLDIPEILDETDTEDGLISEEVTPSDEEKVEAETSVSNNEEKNEMLILTVNGTELMADFADNSSAEALKELLKGGAITIGMRDYGNMEKVGDIGQSLPENNEQITTEAGDLILYMGSAFVIYYDTNRWNFTRLGKIRDVSAEELKEILGSGNVTVSLSVK